MVALVLAATLSANFDVKIGKIRPELHSSGFGPTICSQTRQDLEDVKAMGFAYARTHDWALINPNERVCDWHHIFPLKDLDATKPENYVFAPTDYLLKRTREETGLEVFFRLGTSIEHSGPKIHFNSAIPEDFDKVAEVFAATVRHYNRGWANGFNWEIKYWEVWNEPDGINNMWCLPEGDLAGEDRTSPAQKMRDERRCALFADFFVRVLKRLKSEFGEEIKVGGPAMCSLKEAWFRPILKACKEAGVAPDFISWHGYTNDPMQFNVQSERGRELLDGYGFTKCEMIVNEWHYFGYGDYDWTDMQHCSDPKVKARIWTGPRSHNGIHSACFTLATLANLQSSKLAQAYYYGCRHTGSWGFKNELQEKYKVFHALRLFGDIVRGYPTICQSGSAGTLTAFAVKGPDGRKALLVVDYGGTKHDLEVEVKGVPSGAKTTCEVLDWTHDLEPHDVKFADGKLALRKNDSFSAAFLVKFEE